MSNLKVNSINDASGGNNAVLYGVAAPTNSMGFRNRILNGSMVIDQRNAGAAVTVSTTNVYSLDRWAASESSDATFTIQQDSSAPTGFTNSAKITVTVADASVAASQYNSFQQKIEGFNCADLAWGTASAATVTLSFWVRSSLTGTFGGALTNSAYNRSYPFTYAISAANTWEQKTVTIAGDTSGTWLTTNGIGITVYFDLGSGTDNTGTANAWVGAGNVGSDSTVQLVNTLNATFYITGVQLEAGSVASPFERRDYGRELMMCQRYFETSFPLGTAPANAASTATTYNGTQLSSAALYVSVSLKVSKRATPTTVIYSSNAVGSPTPNQPQYFNNAGAGWTNTSGASVGGTNDSSFSVNTINSATAGFSYWSAFGWTSSAEL
jgi:hypothetical protein